MRFYRAIVAEGGQGRSKLALALAWVPLGFSTAARHLVDHPWVKENLGMLVLTWGKGGMLTLGRLTSGPCVSTTAAQRLPAGVQCSLGMLLWRCIHTITAN